MSANPMYWKKLDNSPVASSRTDDIWFFDENEGWLVNSSGYVCKTTDGGECWQPKFYLCPASKGKPYLRCMGWGSRQVGWFGSVTGIGDDVINGPDSYLDTLLHHTKDGGETWEPVLNLPRGTSAGICGFYAVDENVAYGSGTNDPGLPGPTIIKTVDGGCNWELIDMSPYADNLIDIYFTDKDNGIVVGGRNNYSCDINNPAYPPPRLSRYAQLRPVVLRTSDGGKTWKNTAENTQGLMCGEWGWKIQFIDDKVGFVSLENFASAAILKTTDGGDSWTRHDVKDNVGRIINNDLEGIGFINERQGWVGGWGYNFGGLMNSYTENGGETWVSQDNNPSIDAHQMSIQSDPRVRINRYRFIGNPVTAGYCSGLQVYKLVITGQKKAAFGQTDGNKKSAFSNARVEPAHGGMVEQPTSKRAMADVPAQSRDNVSQMASHDFAIEYKNLPDGKVEISYNVPDNTENVFVGLWNQLAFYVRTLTSGPVKDDGRQTLIWDGCDDVGDAVSEGVYICRLSVNGRQGGSEMVVLGK